MNSRRSVCSYDVMVKRQQDARRLEQLHPPSRLSSPDLGAAAVVVAVESPPPLPLPPETGAGEILRAVTQHVRNVEQERKKEKIQLREAPRRGAYTLKFSAAFVELSWLCCQH